MRGRLRGHVPRLRSGRRLPVRNGAGRAAGEGLRRGGAVPLRRRRARLLSRRGADLLLAQRAALQARATSARSRPAISRRCRRSSRPPRAPRSRSPRPTSRATPASGCAPRAGRRWRRRSRPTRWRRSRSAIATSRSCARPTTSPSRPGRAPIPGGSSGSRRADGDLVTNSLVYLLQRPSQIADTSWIKPGKVAWDWWNDRNLAGVSFKPGVNTQTYEFFIDFAARFGIEYIILDEGWYKTGNLLQVRPASTCPRCSPTRAPRTSASSCGRSGRRWPISSSPRSPSSRRGASRA